ncbi:MAG: hypothetical protein L0Y60_17075 [Beijerinckiaceae bacterium]|nr:hypothetical protein [Beijerinckiaceae bacterium]
MAAHWEAMAKAAGFQFDAADKAAIASLVISYYQWQPFEKSAPFVADVKKHLAKLDKAADVFYQALHSGEALGTEIERNAAFHAVLLIEGYLKRDLKRVDDFANEMFAFLAATAAAGHELKAGEGKGFVEGEDWNRLINSLGKWFASKGHKVTAAKGYSKTSPFVAFVRELQATFPERFKRHHYSDGALAKTISDALVGL